MNILGKNCALLTTDRVTRRYFCDIDVAEGFLLLSKTPVYFTDARYFYAVQDKIQKATCKLYKGLDDIKKELESQQIKTLYLDYDRTTMTEYGKYEKSFNVEIKDGSEWLKEKRLIKNRQEIEKIRRACEVIQHAYYAAIDRIREGMTEKELRDILEEEAFALGAEEMSFDTIVAFGENSAIPHHVTGDTKLKSDVPVLIDCGCKIEGYCSDYTRTAFFGTPSEKFVSVYNAVKTANEKAEEEIQPDMPLKDADAIARDYLKSVGFDKYFTHSLGHGVGLEIHESPAVSPKGEGALPKGIVFTVEPGVYLNGEFGVRIEDTVYMTPQGVQRFFTDTKDLIIL